MTKFFSSQRFLAAYSGLLTLAFLLAILSGFARVEPKQTFDEINVHRINVVEPDGTIRLVLTNTANSPGIYIKNKEVPHPNGRKSAGLLFFDEDGTEDGGLSYGITKNQTGKVTGSEGHLSFDQYMQDQIFTIDAGRDGDKKYSLLRVATIPSRTRSKPSSKFQNSRRINAKPKSKNSSKLTQEITRESFSAAPATAVPYFS